MEFAFVPMDLKLFPSRGGRANKNVYKHFCYFHFTELKKLQNKRKPFFDALAKIKRSAVLVTVIWCYINHEAVRCDSRSRQPRDRTARGLAFSPSQTGAAHVGGFDYVGAWLAVPSRVHMGVK